MSERNHSNGNGTRNLWGAIGLVSTFLVIAMSVAFGYISKVDAKTDLKEDKVIVAKNYDLLLFEVRELRTEIKDLRDEVVAMRTVLSGYPKK